MNDETILTRRKGETMWSLSRRAGDEFGPDFVWTDPQGAELRPHAKSIGQALAGFEHFRRCGLLP